MGVLIIRGGGKQGSVVYWQVADKYAGWRVVVWDDGNNVHHSLQRFERLKADDKLSADEQIHCFVCVGSGATRKLLLNTVRQRFPEAEFPTFVHPSAVVHSTARIGQGCFVGAFALVNVYATVGDFCLVNTSALVEHDCVLEDFVTINPAAVLLGTVHVGTLSTIGANSCVREQSRIPPETVVGMQAAMVNTAISASEKGLFWGGVPAKPLKGRAKKLQQQSGTKLVRWLILALFLLVILVLLKGAPEILRKAVSM